ncbi:MAG TPA: copper homeostasis protein CutC [Vicinamibacterales bacterium]|nr:copper homeostasis protein CutC [Vicinamibacterales bacterium]
MVNRILIEVIVQTVDDARAAGDGGADRLEVVRAIDVGGLTPDLAVVEAIARVTSLPLRVMVRENGGFETSDAEIAILRAAAWNFTKLRVDGLVAGFAKSGELLLPEFAAVIESAPGIPITFHRAFDSLADPLAAIDALASNRRVDHILTSGGEGTISERCDRLRLYVTRADPRLTIIAGGGVDLELFRLLAERRTVREIHVGRLARDGGNANGPVSAASVRRLRDISDGIGPR